MIFRKRHRNKKTKKNSNWLNEWHCQSIKTWNSILKTTNKKSPAGEREAQSIAKDVLGNSQIAKNDSPISVGNFQK